MNLEEQLREAFAPLEPGLQAEAAVMSRVSAAAWHRSRSVRRRPGRTLLFGTILIVAAAAAAVMLVQWHPRPVVVKMTAATDEISPAVPASAPSVRDVVPPDGDHAIQESVAPSLRTGPTPEIPRASIVRQVLEGLAVDPAPTSRHGKWGLLRNQLRPELVQLLVAALRDSMDDAFRKEVVTLLAMKYADDPVAREALAEVAASGADTLMRQVAEHALSGDGPWHDYAVTRMRDTSLPIALRLEAWYWMADAMPLDQEKMRDMLAGALTALQAGDGVGALADLLASTQGDPGGSGYGLAGQQGQWTMRGIASVIHPAVPDLLIACFDAMPNYLTLNILAERRDNPRVAGKLESIAAGHPDEQLRSMAASRLRLPLKPLQYVPTGN